MSPYSHYFYNSILQMVINQNILAFVSLFGGLVASGCTNVSHEPVQNSTTPIYFGTSLTRSAVDENKKGMQDFLVWGGYGGENNLFNAETVTPDGLYSGGYRYWVDGRIHNFYALHPKGVKNVVCSSDNITVTDFDSSEKRGIDAVDLMTASAVNLEFRKGQTAPVVNLRFSHSLSRVRFNINTMAKVKLTGIKLVGIAYKGTFSSQTDGTSPWSNLVVATDDSTPFLHTEPIPLDVGQSLDLLAGNYDAANNNYGDLLLIPQTITKDAVFSLTWTYDENGKSRTVNVPLPFAGAMAWEPGMSYQYSATIPLASTDISLKVEVLGWNDKRIDADL